jgi:threonylcarbamoyladenosine tRNA methylthiotransferase MtaB
MKRRYTTELFANKVHKIKEKMPHACIAADVITGFPNETDELFDQTYQFINSLPLSMLHVFPYSKRPNTIAATMNNQQTSICKNKRTTSLIRLSNLKKEVFYKENIGKTAKVLIENKIDENYMFGFTENYVRVRLPYNPQFINEIKTVKILGIDETNGVCEGEIAGLKQ